MVAGMIWASGGAGVTGMFVETGEAGAYSELPPWLAVIEQLAAVVPVLVKKAIVPETVQTLGVVDAKLTGNPDVAEA